MYLAELAVKNYRCLKELTVKFQPGLNVIAGENNSGKTALVDALRHVLGYGSERREIYFTEDDVYHDTAGERTKELSEFHATLRELSEEEKGGFSQCLNLSKGEDAAELHFRFAPVGKTGGRQRFRVTVWGGEHEGESIPTDTCEGIRPVYLEALRDVRVGLTPGRGSRIAELLGEITTDAERTDLEALMQKTNSEIEQHKVVQAAEREINARLADISGGGVYGQKAGLRVTAPEFRRIAESLRALIGGQFEIAENGLGYNNLLYIATVLSVLVKAQSEDEEPLDIGAMLVEEPEAHLHPHLQTVLVDYLQQETTTQSGVQVFLTTHSPVIASRAPLTSLNVLHITDGAGIHACRDGRV